MAGRLILGIANPALDANGEVDADATLTYYENLTTTPQAIYADEGLSTPLTNPLTCDAAGRFPMVWAPDDAVYTVKWTPTGAADITWDYIFPSTNVYQQLQNQGVGHITITIDGNGSTPSTGVQEDGYIGYDCTIVAAVIQATGTGSAVVTPWVKAYADSSPPTVSNKISASAPITLSSAQSSRDTTLTGWTKDIDAGSAIRWNLDSVSGITKLVATLVVVSRS